MDELKPCPFCGKDNALDQYPCDFLDGAGGNVVRCAWCHGAAPLGSWNRRAASGGDSASLEQRGRAGVSLASLASIEALIVDAYRDGMQMRSFDMVAARNAIAAALANQQEGDINPSGPSFQAGYDTGHSEFQWLAGLVNNPVCERCGATSDADAETKCRPTDCSCPGTEFPLAQLWALQRTEANQQGVGADALRYAAYFRWLMRGKNLELAAALMAKDQYATLRRLCESLVPLDDAPTQPAGDVGREEVK